MNENVRAWIADSAVGGLVGLVVGWIVAVNVVIFAGIDRGYEASIGEIFNENWLVGAVAVLILVAGPVGGIMAARIRRAHREVRIR